MHIQEVGQILLPGRRHDVVQGEALAREMPLDHAPILDQNERLALEQRAKTRDAEAAHGTAEATPAASTRPQPESLDSSRLA